MPRGRHRHSPPLHRLLPPSVIAGVSVVCAVGPWLFTEPLVLRGLAAGAAVTTILGSVVMRRWDLAAGKRVADLTRARASDEWRHEERVAELETDLEESRELRAKLEQRLRAKRTELANLRNEHAALLRRYATAETERASALEGRRRLAIEAAPASPELSAPVAEAPATEPDKDAGPAPSVPRAFSPEGPALFAAANEALARLARVGTRGVAGEPDAGAASEKDSPTKDDPDDDGGERASADPDAPEALEATTPEAEAAPEAEAEPAPEQEPPAASQEPQPRPPAATPAHTTGHFTVPTAVAVVPSAPRPRPAVEGGFDFFGTKSRQSLESVQNEDLADVVGQEALAVHKAESESGFKSADPEARAVGQVIDLTAHDETERIDVQGLRSAAS
ncbi:hypothetical protein ACFYZE_03745 [Streptomyces sp. NPDC001796]|uniref:hypothetical protein n=1 Tax=Streptomyces sp. NPDC001796 TaxID=3364609 RepID=UPI00367C5EAD